MEKLFALFFGFFLFSSCNKNVDLIYSPDKQHFISRFDITEEEGKYTIFVYGKYIPDKMPNSYIKVRYKWRDAWYGLIRWNGEEVTLYHPYHDFEAVNLDNSPLKKEIMSSQEFSSYFFDKIPNDFIKVSSIPEYNSKQ